MTHASVETKLLESLGASPELRAETLDDLACALLSDLAGAPPRVTDGLIIAREEVSEHRYLAAAHVYMISDQRIEPLLLDLAINPNGAFGTGRLFFGIDQRDTHKRNKLNDLLAASPQEASAAIPWAFVMSRAASAWSLTTREREIQGEGTGAA